MRLPQRQNVNIPEDKIRKYLLSSIHPFGRHKAFFFKNMGFNSEHWETIVSAIRDHAQHSEVARVDATEFGTRYVVEGQLQTPNGRNPVVRVVWFVEKGDTQPRLVTAYPMGGGIHD
jgi:hypothetical protein